MLINKSSLDFDKGSIRWTESALLAESSSVSTPVWFSNILRLRDIEGVGLRFGGLCSGFEAEKRSPAVIFIRNWACC